MEKIIIRVKDKDKAKTLYELLRLLDFIESIDTGSSEEEKRNHESQETDFFASAGLWEGRDVTQASLRQKAWPSRS